MGWLLSQGKWKAGTGLILGPRAFIQAALVRREGDRNNGTGLLGGIVEMQMGEAVSWTYSHGTDGRKDR